MIRSRSPLRWMFALCALVALMWQSDAYARRVALIIGNSSYAHAQALRNPRDDAELVGAAARKAGFDVSLAFDLSKADFDQALRDFRTQADGAEVALIYYAGHGMESSGKNWLIPVDAKLAESRDLRYEAIELDGLLETLNNAVRRVVILDACRNNPFGNNWNSGVRTVQRGLAMNEIEGALVIYAAAGGQVATDGAQGNSPFALAVAKRLPEPGLLLQMLGPKVTDDVAQATGGAQRPWTNSGMGGQEFFLVPLRTAQSSADQQMAEAYAWRYADRANTVEDYKDYLSKFPNGAFSRDAQDRIAKLGQQRPAASAPAVVATASTLTPRDPDLAAVTAPAASPPSASPAAVVAPRTLAAPPKTNRPPKTGAPDTVGLATLHANRSTDLAPLPTLPPAPAFDASSYPACREDYQGIADPLARVNSINSCLARLNEFSAKVLNPYLTAMTQHQEEISKLYTDQVGGQDRFTEASQQKFYGDMRKEYADSARDGAHFAEFRAIDEKLKADRTYLQDRYCFSTGACGGYPVPPGIAAPPASVPGK